MINFFLDGSYLCSLVPHITHLKNDSAGKKRYSINKKCMYSRILIYVKTKIDEK
jgi:hypothetical protein